jgi:diguanylate cyclase (GGDEF)-like protein
MNGMDGLEMTQRIKEKYDTDIIVITGYAGDYSYEEAIRKGADDFVFKPVRLEELLLRLKRVIRERELTKERNTMVEQLKALSITDDLTKLYNSRYFYQQLQNEIKRFYRYHRPLALLLIDIDHFKFYNDTYGHLEGDKILLKVGGLISSCLRSMDTAYRYGGEEFTVILPETSCDAALIVAERVLRTVQSAFFDANLGTQLTVSIGVSEYADSESMNDFIKRTDKAMYIAKGRGRNCISFLLP